LLLLFGQLKDSGVTKVSELSLKLVFQGFCLHV